MRVPLAGRARTLAAAVLVWFVAGCAQPPAGDAEAPAPVFTREDPFVVRPLSLERGGGWIGEGVAYGEYRDGQHPGGPSPTREQIREDLRLIARDWKWIRVYRSVGFGDTLLSVLREEKLPIAVMLGVWIGVEESFADSQGSVQRSPEVRAANRRDLDAAVRLAGEYPDLVTSLCVGNETQVAWTAHRSPNHVLAAYLREARARTRVPVTTADDFNYWNKPESDSLAAEVDFIAVNAHALWNGQSLENALPWTQSVLADIRQRHPDRLVVLSESGWATKRHTEGDQAKYMKGRLGEPEQAQYFRAYRDWVRTERVPSFFFSAFDENWKGGEHPDEVEKHWGLYRADRTPKRALAGGR